MRKATYILALALLAATLPSTASAQGITIGVKGGLNMANVSGDQLPDTKMNSGLMAGAFVNIGLGPTLSIQPEAFFSQKGTSMPYADSLVTVDSDWNLSYVEVPVLVRLGFGLPGAPVRPVVFAGPSAGFLLGSKLKAEVDGTSFEVDSKDSTKPMDFGAVVGAGLELGSIQVDARYSFGLTNIYDVAGAVDAKNRTLTLMIGYGFGLGM